MYIYLCAKYMYLVTQTCPTPCSYVSRVDLLSLHISLEKKIRMSKPKIDVNDKMQSS